MKIKDIREGLAEHKINLIIKKLSKIKKIFLIFKEILKLI